MDKITYSIVSRGELKINYKKKSIKITGELTSNPPIFYADIVSLEKAEGLDDKERKHIIEFISKDSLESIGTEIIFD